MTLFIVIGIFILVATLAFLFFPVFRELKTGDGGIASRQTKALKQALDAGVHEEVEQVPERRNGDRVLEARERRLGGQWVIGG